MPPAPPAPGNTEYHVVVHYSPNESFNNVWRSAPPYRREPCTVERDTHITHSCLEPENHDATLLRNGALRARGRCESPGQSHPAHSASASSSSPSVLCRFDRGSASSAPPASTSSSASASPPSSSAPVLPPLTARFAAFSSDFCFSCSLYAARANGGVSGPICEARAARGANSQALGSLCEASVLGLVAVCGECQAAPHTVTDTGGARSGDAAPWRQASTAGKNSSNSRSRRACSTSCAVTVVRLASLARSLALRAETRKTVSEVARHSGDR